MTSPTRVKKDTSVIKKTHLEDKQVKVWDLEIISYYTQVSTTYTSTRNNQGKLKKTKLHHGNISDCISDHANIGPSTKNTSEQKGQTKWTSYIFLLNMWKFFRLSQKHKLSKHKEMTTDVTRNIEARNLTRHKDNNNEKTF